MKAKILHMLKNADQQWLSGEEICRRLDISRTAVWKHVHSLKQDGYQIQSQPRRGYQLVTSPDCLYPWEITPNLATNFIGHRVIHHHQLLSTNDEAKRLVREKMPPGTVVVTEEQIGGRGRLGRQWYGAKGRDIALSVLLYPTILPTEAPRFSMLAAVAVANALQETCGLGVGIKWPNDVLLQGRKVCGILVEMAAEMDRVKYIILGIGLNVNSTAEMWPEEIRNSTTSLCQQLGEPVNRVELVRSILSHLEKLYLQWSEEGFAPVMAAWRAWCISLQCSARVQTIHGEYTGWVEGVDDSGALLLRLEDGSVQSFLSGDVSLRPSCGQVFGD